MREIDQKLFDAADQGNLSEVKKCLNRGADVLARNSHHTVLHSAVRSDNGKVVKLVLNKIKETQGDVSQYIDAKDTEGDTPLMWAVEGGKVNAAKVLLDHGADIEVKNNDGMTALHWAAQENHLGVTKLLVDDGANIHAVDNSNRTALYSVKRNLFPNPKIAKLLGGEYDSPLVVGAQMAVGATVLGGAIAGVCAIGVVPLIAVGLGVGAVVAVANAPRPVYDEERRGRLAAAAGGAQPGSLHYYQMMERVRRELENEEDDGCVIQSYQK